MRQEDAMTCSIQRASPGLMRDSGTMTALRFDVFGRQLLIVRTEPGWSTFYIGPEGKRRPASNLVVPASVAEAELERYLADLCHEWATEKHPDVRRLDQTDRSESEHGVERAIEDLLSAVTRWAAKQTDITGVALVGSYARGAARSASDIDLVVLSRQPERFLEQTSWAACFGEMTACQVEHWGRVTSLRVCYRNHLEVEFGLTTPEWASLPVDAGTRRVVAAGLRILLDRDGSLHGLRDQVSSC